MTLMLIWKSLWIQFIVIQKISLWILWDVDFDICFFIFIFALVFFLFLINGWSSNWTQLNFRDKLWPSIKISFLYLKLMKLLMALNVLIIIFTIVSLVCFLYFFDLRRIKQKAHKKWFLFHLYYIHHEFYDNHNHQCNWFYYQMKNFLTKLKTC